MTSQSVDQAGAPVPQALAAAGVLFASICFGIVPYFARGLAEQGLAPQAVAFYRYVITGLVLCPVLVHQRRHWRAILWGLAGGAVMGLGWTGYAAAIRVVPASTVGVLYMTYPVFTVAIAWIMFGDRPTGRALIAAALVLLAAIVAGNPQAVPVDQIPALILALTAPLGFGFGICVLVFRLSRIPPLARIASATLGAVIALAPMIVTSDAAAVIPANLDVWLMVAGLALGSALVPQLVYTVCTPIVGASRAAVFGSIELPTMFAVSVFALGEPLTWPQIVACILIVSAIALTNARATRNVTTNQTRS
ncbi:DMT family transporter [Chachezhania sediminis]|uniref:DMT family transporter n=1 Tax=Chachezhania sediminis TaxID=2599291 RepID=UPI00131BA78B|nr:DMT family transporter [Chachezhania sediminis]